MVKKVLMKVLLTIVALLGVDFVVYAMDAAESDYPENCLTFGVKPFISAEYERCLVNQLDLVVNYSFLPNIFSSGDNDKFTLYSRGLSYYPLSNSLQGVYIGVDANRFKTTGSFLGLKFKNNSYADGYAVSLGYKKVYDSGFALDLGAKKYFFDDDNGTIAFFDLGFGW